MNPAQNPTDTLLSFFAALDQLDAGAMGACCSDGVTLVDEISRCWLRGRPEVEAYLLKTLAATETVQSQLGDIWSYPNSVDSDQGFTGESLRVLMNCCS